MTELILPVAEQVGSAPLTWDMAKQMLQTQSTLATIAITVLATLAVLLVGFSWFRATVLDRRQRRTMEDSLRSDITAKLTEQQQRHSEGLKKEVEDKLERMRQELTSNMTAGFSWSDIERSRMFAFLTSSLANRAATAATWWAQLIKQCVQAKKDTNLDKANLDKNIRTGVSSMLAELGRCSELEEDKRDLIEDSLPYIPTILSHERRDIEQKLKQLRRK